MAISINSQATLSQAFKAMTQVATQSSSINSTNAANALNAAASTSSAPGSSLDFSQILDKAMEGVNASTQASELQTSSLLTGQTQELHSVVIAAEKADVALKLTLQVRNKVLDAYQEMMRMQI